LATPNNSPSHRASRSASSDREKLRVFISYSREDNEFADQLEAALNTCGFDCVLDREGISGGEDWKSRLGVLIAEADTVVFALSPASAESEICNWEVDESTRLGKRILPVICRALGEARPPASLQAINYVFFYHDPKTPGSGFGEGLKRLVEALNTDFEWLLEHTRYLQRASEWEKGGRPANRLLSGDDISEAKAWVARRPKAAPAPTVLQLGFIRASEREAEAQLSAKRQRLAAMAAAQEERENALREREVALKLAQDEQRKRATLARIRNILLVIALILTAAAIAFAWIARRQQLEAEAQKNEADAFLKKASEIIVSAQDKFDDITQKEAFELFRAGAAHGDRDAMRELGASYQHGLGVAQDYAKARDWYEKAAGKGDSLAMARLGSLYAYGQGVTQDSAKADQWYKRAAETGDPLVMFQIKALGGNFQGVLQAAAKARGWYEKAAERGDPLGMVGLGLLYAYGQGVPRDLAKAREWFEKAALKGNPYAAIMLSTLDDVGNDGEQGYTEAARGRLEKEAEKGDPFVMSGLGLFYSRHQNYTQAGSYADALRMEESRVAKTESRVDGARRQTRRRHGP
jgi:TPR repeat protein